MRIAVWFVLLLGLPVASAFAQGKIAGTVTDAGTGDPLIGVNVVIDGTQQGTVTNTDGNYVIVNVRPGEYTLVFSYIGFRTQRVTGVRVTTGQTTRIDLEMQEEVIEGEEIVVRAERPLVQKDLTASKKTVVAEEIDQLPVEGFLGVLSTQAGVTQGASGELHIRGGRSNEISYLVDGLSVGNPFVTNGLATSVAVDAIQEMTVISGAFNAEYGRAMSGIVNLVTKEGGDRIDGSFSAYGGDTFTSNGDVFRTPSGVSLNNYTLEGTLSGPVPVYKKLRFFLSGRYDSDDGHIFGVRQHLPSDSANFNTNYWEIHGRPWWEYLTAEQVQERFGFENPEDAPFEFGREMPSELVSMNPRSDLNFLGKLTVRPFRATKLEYSFLRDRTERTPFSFAYRFNPDGVAQITDNSYNHSLHWTHTLDDRMFYKVRASYATTAFRQFLYEDPTDPRYVKDQGGIGDGNVIGFPGNNFLFGGNQKTHIYEDSRSIRMKADVTRQIGFIHEAQAGIDMQLHSLDRENFVVLFDGNRYREPTVPPLDSPSRDRYEDQRVVEFSAYAQDKLEFDSFIINAGLRYERFDPNGQYIPNLLEPRGELAEAETKNLLLPRLGVSFPITERGIIHFSYGHFAQMPSLRDMYRNPEFEFALNATPTFGNTNMRPERTVQYEIGLQQQIGELLAFDVTGYFKDIRDYLARQLVQFSTIAGENQYRIFLNKDYANVKGVTFSLTKRRGRGGLLSANVDYTFQIAEGNRDDTDAFFFNFLSDRENELEIVPLDFDQRHVLSSTVTLARPGNWGLSFISQFATGYPYSPALFDENLDLLPNSDRKPTQLNLDMQAYKEFQVGGLGFRAFAKVFNVLDRMNERFVFNDTGRATYSLSDERNLHAAWEPLYGLPGIQDLDEYDTRPHWFSAPREIRVGLTLNL
ncbi:MAG: outer membrane beta-barrel protein [Bacteroidetes bacterium]|jgi:outer membrane receptor protein involved in Fe transport|nr:outer membrane beta-barrel protein [Bacteroidota bacterium]